MRFIPCLILVGCLPARLPMSVGRHRSLLQSGSGSSGIGTVVVVPLTSNLVWGGAPGNVLLESRSTGLPRDSIANSSQIVALERVLLTRHVGHLATHLLDRVLEGIDIVLDR